MENNSVSAATQLAQQWDKQISSAHGSFLQSYAWGEFQEQYGRTVDRFSDSGFCAQTIVYPLPFGKKYLFTPYGPAGDAASTAWPAHLQQLAQTHNALFWRYERGGSQFGGKPVANVHPALTTVVPLADEKTMLAQLKSKWRYNIGLAERKGVTVRQSSDPADVRVLYELLSKTAQRQGIQLHPQRYYQLMMTVLGQVQAGQSVPRVSLYFAEYQGQTIAAALVARYHDTVTYVHGGADYASRAVMAPHLLHWRIMSEAAAAGFTQYDLFGIAPPHQPKHPWAGITQFKLGFGGRVVEFPGTYELPLQTSWYTIYRLIKRTRLWI